MNERTGFVRVVVTQTVTTLVLVTEGVSDQDIANRAVAQVLGNDQGWSATDNPWSVEIIDGGGGRTPLSPDFEAVDAIRYGGA